MLMILLSDAMGANDTVVGCNRWLDTIVGCNGC